MRIQDLARVAVLVVLGASSANAGDAALGEKVFLKCKACHNAAEPAAKVGPSLLGLFGRTSGTYEGYAYSPAMKAAAIVWDEATLKEYLVDPKAKVPGTKMAFAGIKKPDELDNLLAYLAVATKK